MDSQTCTMYFVRVGLRMGGAIHGRGRYIILYVCDVILPDGQSVHVLSAGVSDNETSLLALQWKKGLKHSTTPRSGVGGARKSSCPTICLAYHMYICTQYTEV